MRRFSSPVFLYPLLALLILVGGALAYLLPWLSSREASLDDTTLRAMAAAGDQLSRRLASMAQVLDALRRNARDPSAHDSKEEYLRARAPFFQSDEVCQYAPDQKSVSVAVVERANGRRFQVSSTTGCISATVESILVPLLPPQGMFDELILADSRGGTIYQTALTGLRIPDLSILPERIPGNSSEKASPSSQLPALRPASVQQLRIGDTDYRLYLMPVSFPGLVNSRGDQATFTLASLIKQAEFRSIALAQSGTVFIWVVLLGLLVLFASWPLLKFTRMGRTERIRRWSGLMLLSSILASTGLATLLILHASYLSDPAERQQTSARLRQLAQLINENTASELRAVLASLKAAQKSDAFRSARLTQNTKPDLDFKPAVRTSVLNDNPVFFATYPYFEDLFWADAFGNQQIKWTAHPIVTPQTNISSFPFFQETLHGNLWAFQQPCPEEEDCDSNLLRFRVDPQYSPNSGQYVAIVSTRFDEPEGPHEGLVIGSILARLATLIDPVLPPDYGFAVIDRAGKILFHSAPGPNIERKFFGDCEDPEVVRAAADSRTPQDLSMDYQGEPHDFYVTPISSLEDCPWTLVVFRKTSVLAAKHIERMLLFFVLVILYGTAAGLIGIAVGVRLPAYPPRWLWPEAARNAEYLQLALGLFLIYFAAVRMNFGQDWRVAVLVSFCCGLGGFLLVWLHLTGRQRPLALIAIPLAVAAVWFGSKVLAVIAMSLVVLVWRRIPGLLKGLLPNESNPGIRYTVAAVALIFVSGVLPCIGFFKIADDFQNVKFLMRDELVTLTELESRAHKLRDRYASILAVRSEINGSAWDLPRALFLRSRLRSTWDRLDGMENSSWIYAEPKVWQNEAWKMIQTLASKTTWVPNPGAELARGVALEPCLKSNGPVCWSLEERDRLRMTRSQRNDTNLLADLSSEETGYLPDSLVTNYSQLLGLNVYAIVGLVLLGVGLFCWLRSSLRRLFLLDLGVSRPWPALELDDILATGKNIVAVGLPRTGKSRALAQRTDVNTVNLAEFTGGDVTKSSDKVSVLDNFDGVPESPEGDKALDLLETLVFCGGRVILVCNADPWLRLEQWLAEAPNDSRRPLVASRWKAVLAGFQPVSFVAPASADGARFERIWWSCTVPEQVALYQLARDGWANHKNSAALIHLCQRGLVVRDPVFKIGDESLRIAILAQITGEQARIWSRAEGPSAWDGLRIVFGIAGFAILALLFFWSQQQGLALLTAGLSAAGSAAKVVADFRGRKADPSKGVVA